MNKNLWNIRLVFQTIGNTPNIPLLAFIIHKQCITVFLGYYSFSLNCSLVSQNSKRLKRVKKSTNVLLNFMSLILYVLCRSPFHSTFRCPSRIGQPTPQSSIAYLFRTNHLSIRPYMKPLPFPVCESCHRSHSCHTCDQSPGQHLLVVRFCD